MHEEELRAAGTLRTCAGPPTGGDGDGEPAGLRCALPRDGRGALRARLPRVDGVLRPAGVAQQAAGALSGGWQRPSGPGRADGGPLGPAGGRERDAGPRFDAPVQPGGYLWWYVDAVSEDGRHALTIIAFVGSVFSPYYAWAGRTDPLNHCAINVALYGPGGRWTMTERGRGALERDASHFRVGPSALSWDGSGLTLALDEIAVPLPRRMRGTVRIVPDGSPAPSLALDAKGRHRWRVVAPRATALVELSSPSLRWRGHAYFDSNHGDEPLEEGFSFWTWSRSALPDGAAVLYEADRRDGTSLNLGLRFRRDGTPEAFEPPAPASLPTTLWRVGRRTRSQDGRAKLLRNLEDAPFYSRAMIESRLLGTDAVGVHESLDLDRFAKPWVRLLLPFRMPRRPRWPSSGTLHAGADVRLPPGTAGGWPALPAPAKEISSCKAQAVSD